MTIRIYDSMARAVVPFETREPDRVAMYVCGPTVYNHQHIGNFRTFLWFDAIRRYLVYRGYDVTFVMNYTDVDDRIIERARIEKLPTDAIAAKYASAFEETSGALGIAPPDILTRATDHIPEMIEAIQGLVDRDVAYEADGNVFFSVERFEGYGKLSHRSLEDMRAGERVEPHHAKREPLDFALWKATKEDEPSWSSPWGPGRPGWHIECSVMSTKYLGMGFDLHGGAVDLVFPHHENEIAQAEALTGTAPFVRHWLHAGHVMMEAEKMSKSLGNVVLARDVVQRYAGDVVRYWALESAYRAQPVFSDASLDDAQSSYGRWKTFMAAARHALGAEDGAGEPVVTRADPPSDGWVAAFVARFIAAMDDDFNSSEAFASIHELVTDANKRIERAHAGDADAREELREGLLAFREMTSVLGFAFATDEPRSELLTGLVDYLLELRESARSEKAFERADAIRAKLVELGVAVEDTPAGPRWRLE